MTAIQTVFGFFEDGLNRTGVLSLCVFKPNRFDEDGNWTGGGQHKDVAYSSWLKWFSPLSHEGNEWANMRVAAAPVLKADWFFAGRKAVAA